MGKVFSMGSAFDAKWKAPVTEQDPWTNVYADGSLEERNFNTEEEALEYISPRWRQGTKTMRVSKLPKEEAKKK